MLKCVAKKKWKRLLRELGKSPWAASYICQVWGWFWSRSFLFVFAAGGRKWWRKRWPALDEAETRLFMFENSGGFRECEHC